MLDGVGWCWVMLGDGARWLKENREVGEGTWLSKTRASITCRCIYFWRRPYLLAHKLTGSILAPSHWICKKFITWSLPQSCYIIPRYMWLLARDVDTHAALSNTKHLLANRWNAKWSSCSIYFVLYCYMYPQCPIAFPAQKHKVRDHPSTYQTPSTSLIVYYCLPNSADSSFIQS